MHFCFACVIYSISVFAIAFEIQHSVTAPPYRVLAFITNRIKWICAHKKWSLGELSLFVCFQFVCFDHVKSLTLTGLFNPFAGALHSSLDFYAVIMIMSCNSEFCVRPSLARWHMYSEESWFATIKFDCPAIEYVKFNNADGHRVKRHLMNVFIL